MMNNDATSTRPSFGEKFIGFVDILGFKSMVMDAEAGRGIPLDEILAAARDLGSEQDRERYERHGPTLCPQAPKMAADVDFQITRISDSLLVSAEISPAGVMRLVYH